MRKIDYLKEKLNLLVEENTENLTRTDIVILSQELDHEVVKEQTKMLKAG